MSRPASPASAGTGSPASPAIPAGIFFAVFYPRPSKGARTSPSPFAAWPRSWPPCKAHRLDSISWPFISRDLAAGRRCGGRLLSICPLPLRPSTQEHCPAALQPRRCGWQSPLDDALHHALASLYCESTGGQPLHGEISTIHIDARRPAGNF